MKQGALLVVVVMLLLSACGRETPTPIIREVIVTATSTTTPEATNTSEPTETPPPTNTPRPRPTHRPTATRTRVPTRTPEPEMLFYEGTGSDVIEIEKTVGLQYFMHIRGNESGGYFGVAAYDSGGKPLKSYVNTTSPYNGTRVLDMADDEETAMLEIQAEGAWTIELRPLESSVIQAYMILTPDQANDRPGLAAVVPTERSGTGDWPLLLLTGEGQAKVVKGTHRGRSNFIVKAYGVGGSRAVFNEIGNFEGKTVLPTGTVLLEVLTEGEWTFTVE